MYCVHKNFSFKKVTEKQQTEAETFQVNSVVGNKSLNFLWEGVYFYACTTETNSHNIHEPPSRH